MARSYGMRFTPALPAAMSALARSWMTFVTSTSAGPPCGGLYLKPPSFGGLWEGVMTMPSARPSLRPRFQVRIACEMTGVGVNPPARWRNTSTPFPARTSMALRWAGTDTAWVSMPR
jgi:hypothetical protein